MKFKENVSNTQMELDFFFFSHLLLMKLSNLKMLPAILKKKILFLKYLANIYYQVIFLYPQWYVFLSTLISKFTAGMLGSKHYLASQKQYDETSPLISLELLEIKFFTEWLQSLQRVTSLCLAPYNNNQTWLTFVSLNNNWLCYIFLGLLQMQDFKSHNLLKSNSICLHGFLSLNQEQSCRPHVW